MSKGPIGMGEQSEGDREKFENELHRILNASDQAGLILRVIGSLAFQLHCPTNGYLQAAMGRAYTDIDFAAYRRQSREITAFLTAIGYVEDREVSIVSEGERSIFYLSDGSLHIDVFYDKLDFCHEISWQDRLEVDAPTIPLAELLLEKMQIFKINEKDIIDTIMLLLEHPLGNHDDETINVDWIAQLCAKDWGLWRTTTMNLDKVAQLAQTYPQISDEQKAVINQKIMQTQKRIAAEPKTLAWRLRDRVGDRVKWYKEVDEVNF